MANYTGVVGPTIPNIVKLLRTIKTGIAHPSTGGGGSSRPTSGFQWPRVNR